jgi:hypothetical protein
MLLGGNRVERLVRKALVFCAATALAVGSAALAADNAQEPDRYLFDRASEVYRVFAEVRQAPIRKPTRSLASTSPIYRSAKSTGSNSVASQIQSSIRLGIVSPDDILLPNAPSHGTQDSSK